VQRLQRGSGFSDPLSVQMVVRNDVQKLQRGSGFFRTTRVVRQDDMSFGDFIGFTVR